MRWVVGIVVIAGALGVGGCGSISNEILYLDAYTNARITVECTCQFEEEVKNPFKDLLSRYKPDMTRRPLPVLTPQETDSVPILDSAFFVPVIAPAKELNLLNSREQRQKTIFMKDESCIIFISPHFIHELVLNPREFLTGNRAKGKMPPDVNMTFRAFNSMSRWDQIMSVFEADTEGLKRYCSIGDRMLTISLLSLKSLLYHGTIDSPSRYYESAHTKCFLGAPRLNREVTYTTDKDYDPEDPEQLNELAENHEKFPVASTKEQWELHAIVSDLGGLYVAEIMFRFPADSDAEQITDRALEFIGQCRFEEQTTSEKSDDQRDS